jgi:hypothetical protein
MTVDDLWLDIAGFEEYDSPLSGELFDMLKVGPRSTCAVSVCVCVRVDH